MLLLKRIITAGVCFVLFFIVLYFMICVIGGAVCGAIAGAQDPENAAKAGEQAGALFVQNNGPYIIMASFVLSLVSSLVLSFLGVFPWCRKKYYQ